MTRAVPRTTGWRDEPGPNQASAAPDAARLTIEGLHAGYQESIDILRGVTMEVPPGQVCAVVGPNGAGKSTLLKSIFGLLRPHRGSVTANGHRIETWSTHRIKMLGISYVTQELNVFPHLTVEESLRMGCWTFRRDRHRVRRELEHVYELLPMLRDLRRRAAHELSGGQGRALAIGKEVISRPRLVLVDEPGAGLSPALASAVYELLGNLQQTLGATVVLVDQQIEEALAIASHVFLMDLGAVRAQGAGAEMTLGRVRELIRECLAG